MPQVLALSDLRTVRTCFLPTPPKEDLKLLGLVEIWSGKKLIVSHPFPAFPLEEKEDSIEKVTQCIAHSV